MTQDPNRPRPHVVNNDEKPRGEPRAKNPSHMWQTVKTVALTTLVGAGVLGGASLLWKTAAEHTRRVLRRKQKAEQLDQSPYGYAAPVYPVAQQATQYATWPQTNMRDIPDALRDGPRLTNNAPPPPQYIPQAAPPQVVVAPSPEIVAEIRRLGAHFDKRFAAVEKRIDLIDNPDDDIVDDDDEDVEEEAPRRRN